MGSIVKESAVSGGLTLAWGAEHRDGNGELVSRQASIATPTPPTCLKPSCIRKYLRDALFYTLVINYHGRRVAYAEANRHTDILERYRTGEPSPKNLLRAIVANIKLRCPICRRVETKW